jgi:hypothetical protein
VLLEYAGGSLDKPSIHFPCRRHNGDFVAGRKERRKSHATETSNSPHTVGD